MRKTVEQQLLVLVRHLSGIGCVNNKIRALNLKITYMYICRVCVRITFVLAPQFMVWRAIASSTATIAVSFMYIAVSFMYIAVIVYVYVALQCPFSRVSTSPLTLQTFLQKKIRSVVGSYFWNVLVYLTTCTLCMYMYDCRDEQL